MSQLVDYFSCKISTLCPIQGQIWKKALRNCLKPCFFNLPSWKSKYISNNMWCQTKFYDCLSLAILKPKLVLFTRNHLFGWFKLISLVEIFLRLLIGFSEILLHTYYIHLIFHSSTGTYATRQTLYLKVKSVNWNSRHTYP